MQVVRLQPVQVGIVRVDAGIVVNVDAGEWLLLCDVVDNLPHQGRFRRFGMQRSGPCAIEVELAGKRAHARSGGLDIADKQQQAARQFLIAIAAQDLLHGEQPGILVAMQQDGGKQPFRSAARQVEERRPRQYAGQ